MEKCEVLELKPPTVDTTNSNPSNSCATVIDRIASTELSYNDFYWQYMQANRPVLLTGISNDWECRRNWTIRNDTRNVCNSAADNTTINFDYLSNKVSNCRVPVADCGTEYFNSHAKIELRFHDFLEHWQTQIANNKTNTDNLNVLNKNKNNDDDTEKTQNHRNLYLKDWHLKALMPDYDFYQVPKHFASDWLNEHLIANAQDDYRFVYMGPKDTWTPFHSDVFGSFSWSTNIVGCKKWIMLPPGEELKLNDRLGNLPFNIEIAKLTTQHVKFYTVSQGENEALFVPSGWYHQVWNLTDTISVNHNWFNACNVARIWRNLRDNMQKVIAEIADCRQMDNFNEHCQTMLRATFGINYLDFLQLLECITMRRFDQLNAAQNKDATDQRLSSKCILFEHYTFNDYHIRHDLHVIHDVVVAMLEDDVVYNCRAVLYKRCMQLMELTNHI